MAGPTVNSGIPPGTLVPGTNIVYNTASARRATPGNDQFICIIGQRLATGGALAGQVINIFTEAQAKLAFGAGSVAHLATRAALIANPNIQLAAVALDDAGGSVAATATITPAGVATAAGSLTVAVANGEPLTVGYDVAATAASIAAALVVAINAKPDLPVTANAVAAVVTLTAKNKGTLGNAIKIITSTTGGGVTVANGPMAGGTTDPVLTPALTAIFSAGHTIISSCYADTTSLNALRAHLDQVCGPIEQRDALAVFGHIGSLATVTTLAISVNHGWISGAWVRGSNSLPYEIAAAYAAIIASESDPARPFNELELPGIAAPDTSQWPSRTEQQSAIYNGVTPLNTRQDGRVRIVRAVSTYSIDAQGGRDGTLMDITTVRTLAWLRAAIRQKIRADFPRAKLSDSDLPNIRSSIIEVLLAGEKLELLERVAQRLDQVIVERDESNPNMVQAAIPADVVNGLHNFAAVINLYI